jgi:DNA-binding transcriptional regulator WhiA
MSIPYFTSLVKDNEFVYLLGFLWADGYISKSTNSIEINITENDFNAIASPLSRHIEWNIFHKQRKEHGSPYGKPQIKAQKSIPDLKSFLIENNYGNKSGGCPHSILSLISEDKQPYWWRGYFDGDGSLAISKNGCKNLAFWSVINQDWSDLSALMTSLEVTFNIYSYRRSCGNSSALTSTRKQSILKFGNYIYPQLRYDFGLKRKFDKFLML